MERKCEHCDEPTEKGINTTDNEFVCEPCFEDLLLREDESWFFEMGEKGH